MTAASIIDPDLGPRVLFFVEPFPVRLRPLDFAWVLDAWEALAGCLEALGAQVAFACSDALSSARAPRFRHFSPSLLGFHPKPAGDDAESDAQWLELMRNPEDATWRPFVRALLDEARPGAVITWTQNAPLRAECRERGLVLVHQELGPFRRPYVPLYFADPAGLNGESSVQALWPELSKLPVTRRQDAELNQFIQACYPLDPAGTAELRQRLGLDPGRRVIAVFGQVSRDSNVLAWSRIAGNETLHRAVLRAANPSRDQVIIKAHPGEPATVGLEGAIACPTEVPAARLVELADAVVTVSSSVGFEALLRGKPVYAFGRATYTGVGATRDIFGGAAELSERFRTDDAGLSAREDEARRRLLHFLSFRYFVPEPEHLDAGALLERIGRWGPLAGLGQPAMEHFAERPAARLHACRSWAEQEKKLGEAHHRTLAEQARAEGLRAELEASATARAQLQSQLELARDALAHTERALEATRADVAALHAAAQASRAEAQAAQDALDQLKRSAGFRFLDLARKMPGVYRAYITGKRLLNGS
jgi:capsular polysaccharide biosynthesis protein/glycosyl transferase family 99